MKTNVLCALAVVSLVVVACGNPCDKLAKAVCEKAKDQKICEVQKARAKTSDPAEKEKCKAQLQGVDQFVEGLQKSQQMKEMFKDFGDGALNKGGTPAPPTLVTPAAPAAPSAPTAPAK